MTEVNAVCKDLDFMAIPYTVFAPQKQLLNILVLTVTSFFVQHLSQLSYLHMQVIPAHSLGLIC